MNLSWQHDMKAFPNITVHYRNSIRTIPAVRTTLTYATEIAYSRGYRHRREHEQRSPCPVPNLYSQYIQRRVDILAAPQAVAYSPVS